MTQKKRTGFRVTHLLPAAALLALTAPAAAQPDDGSWTDEDEAAAPAPPPPKVDVAEEQPDAPAEKKGEVARADHGEREGMTRTVYYPQPAPERDTEAAPPEPKPKPGARTRDGFHLRMGLGGGSLRMTRQAEASSPGAGGGYYQGESSVEGSSGAFELTLGGTPTPGLILGGTLLLQGIDEEEAVLEREDGSEAELGSGLGFMMLGFTIDYYPDPHGGFHFGGTLGGAVAFAETPDNEGNPFEYIGGAGSAASVMIGYDWWVSDQWSLGGMLRATGASLRGEDRQLGIEASEESEVGAIALMFTGTYH